MYEPDLLIGLLNDVPLDGVYIQPLLLKPKHDSVDKLVAYVRFLLAAQQIGIPVIAGRVGAFGLILEALGIAMFDTPEQRGGEDPGRAWASLALRLRACVL